jgi:retron-type reverse transcriptase
VRRWRPTGWVLEIDITAYFDSIVRKELMQMIEKRVSDRSVLQLIGKWIKVGVIEEGRLLVSETGTGQGQTISPLLANIYLHYVLDEWFEEVVKPRLRGDARTRSDSQMMPYCASNTVRTRKRC